SRRPKPALSVRAKARTLQLSWLLDRFYENTVLGRDSEAFPLAIRQRPMRPRKVLWIEREGRCNAIVFSVTSPSGGFPYSVVWSKKPGFRARAIQLGRARVA